MAPGPHHSTTDKARIAVIGAGWWATSVHIPALLRNPDAQLVALCDRSSQALARAVAAFGPLPTYTDLPALLAAEPLDGAIVATNHVSHYELTRQCLEAGLHVLVEKPMVLRAAHAHELLRLAEARGRELIVGYPHHFTPLAQRARAIVQSGELGAVQLVSCLMSSMVVEFYRGNDQAYQPLFGYPVTGPGKAYADPALSGGGQGHLQVTHAAGLLFFVTGLRAERVCGFMANGDVPVDLVDALSVRFEPAGGQAAIGAISSTGNIGPGDPGRLELSLYCANGHLTLDQLQGKLSVWHSDGGHQEYEPPPAGRRYPQFATSGNLVDVILGRAANGSPALVGARAVELLDAAYRSAASEGAPIRIADLD